MKDERDVLTRRIIIEKLNWECKRSIVLTLPLLLISGIVYVMVNLICAMALPDGWGIVKRLIPLIAALAPIITSVVSIIRAILRIGQINRGEFTVTEDTLTEIRDNELSFWLLLLRSGGQPKAYLHHTFRFESGKQMVINAQEFAHTRLSTAAEYSLPGDRFYLVTYTNTPNKIVLLFSAKTHTYKEN